MGHLAALFQYVQHQPRRPAGTPVGGQFAPTNRPEAVGLELVDEDFFDLIDETERGTDDPMQHPVPGPDHPGPSVRGHQHRLTVTDPDNDPPVAPEPPAALPFGLDPLVLDDARRLVAVARTVAEGQRIDPATWSAAESAVTAAGRHLAAVIDSEICRRHPHGFPGDLDYRDEIAASREATLEVLASIRSLGLPAGEQLELVDSQKPAVTLLNEVAGRFPSAWLAASQGKDPPLRARVSPHRAHYVPSRSYFVDEGTQLREVRYIVHDSRYVPKGVEAERTSLGSWTWTAMEPRRVRAQRRSAELTVPSPKTRPAEARATATHELTHRLEHANHQLGYLEEAFLRRRCRDENGQLRPARPIAHMRSERARDGGFVNPYVGKVYPTTTFHEVLSTGTEAVFSGSYGGLVGRFGEKMDPDHRAFVLGCLAVA